MANTPYIDLVKPAGTDKALISVLNANSDKIDSAVGGVQDALAIVCNGNTHGAITSGQYVYVRAHETLQEGLYTANSNIAANAALSSSNLTANSSGGLNALNEQIGTLNSNFTDYVNRGITGFHFNPSNEGNYTVQLEEGVFLLIFTRPSPDGSHDGMYIAECFGLMNDDHVFPIIASDTISNMSIDATKKLSYTASITYMYLNVVKLK